MADMNSIKTVINQLDEIVETMKIIVSGNRDEVDNLTMCVNTLKAWAGMNVEAGENTLPIQRVSQLSELLFEFNEWAANDRRSTTVKQLVDGFIKEKFK